MSGFCIIVNRVLHWHADREEICHQEADYTLSTEVLTSQVISDINSSLTWLTVCDLLLIYRNGLCVHYDPYENNMLYSPNVRV